MFVRLAPLWATSCLWISPEEHADRRDFDGDGVPAPLDCNDANLHVAPGLPEIACNLTDDDCDPQTADGPAFSVAVTYPTIQMALDLASPGAEIGLCAGTFSEALTIRRDGVTLSGNPDLPSILSTEQREGASITVEGSDVKLRLLEIRGGTGNERDGTVKGGVIDAVDALGDLTLEDVVVHDGAADVGGGIAGPALHALHLIRTTVRDNVASELGGGVYTEGAVVMDATEITANAAERGGGMWIGPSGTVDAVGSRVEGNGATDGAGLFVAGDVSGLEVRANDAADRGGGVWLEQGDLVDVVCVENVADRGGGVAGAGTVTRGTVEANVAGEGGGLWFSDSGTLVGVSVRSNTATTGPGGGVYAYGAELVVTDDASSATPTRIEHNSSVDRGGGIAVDGGGFRVTRAVVSDNTGDIGGGLAAYGVCGTCDANLLQDVQFVQNHATDGGGWYTEVDLTAAELVVTDNVATGRGGGAFVYGGEVNDTFGAYERNAADVGGGLAWAGRGVLAQASIVGNSADEGGGIVLESGANLDASQVTFTGNLTEGAVLSGTGGQISLSTVWFDGNTGYSFRVCDQPCTAASAAVDYLGDCTFPSPGCDEVVGFCAEPVPECP